MLGACGPDDRPTVTIAAASDVRLAFEEMEEQFEDSCECDVVYSFGSSGMLASQIEEGLPVDAFFSANESYIDQLEEGGRVLPDSRRLYAVGRIVVASSSRELRSLDDLVGGDIGRVALPNPEHAPYGLAGRQALEASGLWDEIEPRLVLGENASQATEFVVSGNADAGIIPLSLAVQNGHRLRYTVIDASLHEPLHQAAAGIAGASQPDLAVQFIEYVIGPGSEIMRTYGFALAGEGEDGADD